MKTIPDPWNFDDFWSPGELWREVWEDDIYRELDEWDGSGLELAKVCGLLPVKAEDLATLPLFPEMEVEFLLAEYSEFIERGWGGDVRRSFELKAEPILEAWLAKHGAASFGEEQLRATQAIWLLYFARAQRPADNLPRAIPEQHRDVLHDLVQSIEDLLALELDVEEGDDGPVDGNVSATHAAWVALRKLHRWIDAHSKNPSDESDRPVTGVATARAMVSELVAQTPGLPTETACKIAEACVLAAAEGEDRTSGVSLDAIKKAVQRERRRRQSNVPKRRR